MEQWTGGHRQGALKQRTWCHGACWVGQRHWRHWLMSKGRFHRLVNQRAWCHCQRLLGFLYRCNSKRLMNKRCRHDRCSHRLRLGNWG